MLFCGIRIIYQALNLNLPKFEISCDRLGVLIYTCQIARAVPIYKYGGSLNIVDIINKNLFDFVYVVLVHASVILGNLMLVLWQDLLSSKVSLEKKSQITKQSITGGLQNSHLQRISRSEVFCNNGTLKHFAKFTGKHLCLFK